jgi:hypothetical protein
MKQLVAVAILMGLSCICFAQAANTRGNGTTCAALPCEVASVSVVAQTVTVPLTTLFTPAADGLFRISVYMSSSPTQGSTWAYALFWTDDVKARNSGRQQLSPGTFSSFSAPVRALAGQPLSYSVSAGASNPPGANYNLSITVEQLQ